MPAIDIQTRETSAGWTFAVTLSSGGSHTSHMVTLTRPDYERLAAGLGSPEECVRESFVFLLEREPKESILRQFDLPSIGRYFPEYEPELRRRLSDLKGKPSG